jgi:hypothetical protein
MQSPILIGDPSLGGFGGVNYAGSNNDLPYHKSPKAWNFLIGDKGLDKRGGCLKDNAVEIGLGNVGVTGLTRFFDGTNRKTLVKVGDQVYILAETGASSPLLAEGTLGADSEIEFESWLGYGLFFENEDLYSFQTGTASKVVFKDQDGNPLTGEKPKGRVIFKHNERLVLIGDRSRVIMSQTDYFDRFKVYDTDKTLLRCFQVMHKDDGTDGVGGCSYKGMIVAFKPKKMFLITGDMAFDNMDVQKYADVGLYDQKSLVEGDDGFLYWYGGPDGKVYRYSTDTGVVDIGKDIQPELDEIDPDLRHLVAGGWYKGMYLLSYPYGKDITYNNRIIAFDTKRNEWVPIFAWNVARFAKFDDTNTLHAGWSNTGFVQGLFTGSSDNGSDIDAYYETKSHMGDEECYLDTLKARVLTDSGMTIGWISDITEGSITAGATGLGDKLADETEAEPSGFMLSDENDAQPEGSILADLGDWTAQLNKFNPRLQPGIRFCEIKFYFHEKSTNPCQIDYLKAFHSPAREE